eukprot:scaffold125706_cov56-Attheya_sp.AAC.3
MRVHVSSQAAGVSTNQNGGYYKSGCSVSLVKKLRITDIYTSLQSDEGNKVTYRMLAKHAKCSRGFAGKIIKEIEEYGGVVDPSLKKKNCQTGIGSRCLTGDNIHIILRLRQENPARSLRDYQACLCAETGKVVSKATISALFIKGLPHKASMRKASVSPCNKFRPENIIRYQEFLECVTDTHPFRWKSCDEKLLKNSELYNTLVRPDPLTGVVPTNQAVPDYRNTYTIRGMCSLDPSQAPFVHELSTDVTNSELFGFFIEDCIAHEYLKRNDILFLDNASWHKGANLLEEYLWNFPSPADGAPLNILIAWLPVASPELNPIELLWNTLMSRLKAIRSNGLIVFQADAATKYAIEIMDSFTHDDVAKSFAKQGYIQY